MKEFITILAAVGISLLITLKSDQQSIAILEGRLLRVNEDYSAAAKVYRRKTSILSVVLFSCGMSFLALSIMFFSKNSALFPIPGFIGLLLSALGICGRIRSFRVADHELDEITKHNLRSTD